MSGRIAAVLAVTAGLLLAGCGTARTAEPVQTRPSPRTHLHGGAPAHVAVIVMENEEFSDVIGPCTARSASGLPNNRAAPGSSGCSAPYIDSLARTYGLANSMFAISHPSLPNYLALTGGSTFGIDSDCTDCAVHATSIVDQLERTGLSWKAYMEDLPRPCFTGASAGDYAKKHDPFAYYTRIVSSAARCARIVPLAQLATDERAHALPRFIWITPNLCHDMHDCGVADGDRFLSRLLPPLLARLGPRGLLFLTWDEGSSDDGCCRLATGGHIVTIVAGPGARRGARLHTPADHYSVLQAIEDVLRLPRLRSAACACTPTLAPLLSSSAR